MLEAERILAESAGAIVPCAVIPERNVALAHQKSRIVDGAPVVKGAVDVKHAVFDVGGGTGKAGNGAAIAKVGTISIEDTLLNGQVPVIGGVTAEGASTRAELREVLGIDRLPPVVPKTNTTIEKEAA